MKTESSGAGAGAGKASGSETPITTITGVQEFHTKLLGNFSTYFNITKNIAKQLKQVKLFDSAKEPELSPAAKRAKAVEAQQEPVGISLPMQLGEQRPVPTNLGGHATTSMQPTCPYLRMAR